MEIHQPLKYPQPWPPPVDEPKPEKISSGFGAVKNWVHRVFYGTHREIVWYEIERQICDQLNRRPQHGDWPSDTTRQRIVKALSNAVQREKEHPLDHVTLHQDDPIVLLFWGCYDDITALIFCKNLESDFGVLISHEAWEKLMPGYCGRWHDDQRTVGVLVEQIMKLLVSEEMGMADNAETLE
jgi:hypothetical protein